MANIGYILLSHDPDSNYFQACDGDTTDHWFLEKASFRLIRPLKRRKFLEALEVLQKGDTFSISMASVFNASPSGTLEVLQALKRKGVAVMFVPEGFALSSSLGRAYLATLRSLAQLEQMVRCSRL